MNRLLVDYAVPNATDDFFKDLRSVLDRHGAKGTLVAGNNDSPTLEEVVEFFADQGYRTYDPKDFFDYYEAAYWTYQNGCPVNWKQRMVAWEAKNKTQFGGCHDC